MIETLPESVSEREAILSDLVGLTPRSHPQYNFISDLLSTLQEHRAIERELPFRIGEPADKNYELAPDDIRRKCAQVHNRPVPQSVRRLGILCDILGDNPDVGPVREAYMRLSEANEMLEKITREQGRGGAR